MPARIPLAALCTVLALTATNSLAIDSSARPDTPPQLLRLNTAHTPTASLSGSANDAYWSQDFPNHHLNGSIETLLEWNNRLVAAGSFLSTWNETLGFVGAWTGEHW